MKISFLVNEVSGGWEPIDTFLAGTEDSIVHWAEELVKRGHEVHVYRNPKRFNGLYSHNGVHYEDRPFYKGGGDMCINVKSSDIAPIEPTLYLTNEFTAPGLDLSAYNGVIWPSKWAINHLPVNNDKIYILPHGFGDKMPTPVQKVAKQCFYASSPDRGLEYLLKIWPSVYEVHPDATLILTYGVKNIDLPGVICLGECDEDTMNDVYATSDLWLHPCSGGELYCMVGKKAQVNGCLPVIIRRGALGETVKTGYMCDDESNYLNLVNIVLDKPMEDRDMLRDEIRRNADAYTWRQSTDVLEQILKMSYTTPILK